MKKYNLKQGIIALSLGSSLLLNGLTGCTLRKQTKEDEPQTTTEESNEEQEIETIITDYWEDVRGISKEELNNYLEKLSNVKTEYSPLIQEAIKYQPEEIRQISRTNQECLQTGKDYHTLLDTIIQNSTERVNPIFHMFIKNDGKNYTEEQITRDRIVRQSLKNAIDNIGPELTEEDICSLEDFTIACIPEGMTRQLENVGTQLENNIFVFDYKEYINTCHKLLHNLVIDLETSTIGFAELEGKETTQENDEENYIASLTRYFENTLNQRRTHACQDRLENGQINSSINLDGTLEFAISAATHKRDNSDLEFGPRYAYDYIIQDKIKAEAKLLLLASLKENKTKEEYYEAIYSSSLEDFLNFFELETDEEIKTFYEIASSIENTIELENLPEEERSKRKETIGNDYKIEILKSATKDLMTHIGEKEDLEIQQALFLFDFIKEFAMRRNLSGDNYSTVSKSNETYEKQQQIEEIFYDFISKYYHKSKERVEELKRYYYYGRYLYHDEDFTNYSSTLDELNLKEIYEKFPLLEEIRNTMLESKNQMPSPTDKVKIK